MSNDNADVAAAYVWATMLALPAGIIAGFWSGNVRSGVYGFVAAFVPAAITFLVVGIARDIKHRRDRYEERLFDALSDIQSKLEELTGSDEADSHSEDSW